MGETDNSPSLPSRATIPRTLIVDGWAPSATVPPMISTDTDGNRWYNSDTLFCSGHSFMADGDVFIAGGTELYSITSPDETTRVNLLYGLE